MSSSYFYSNFFVFDLIYTLCLNSFNYLTFYYLKPILMYLLTPFWYILYVILLEFPHIVVCHYYLFPAIKLWKCLFFFNISNFNSMHVGLNTFLLLLWVLSLLYVYYYLFIYIFIYSPLRLWLDILNHAEWLYDDSSRKEEFLNHPVNSEELAFFTQKKQLNKPNFIFSKNKIKYKLIIFGSLILDYPTTNSKKRKTIDFILKKLKTIFTNIFAVKKKIKCFYDFFFYKDATPMFITLTELYSNRFNLLNFFIVRKFKIYSIRFKNNNIYLKLKLFYNFIVLICEKVLTVWRPISARLPYFKKINKK